MPSSSDDAAALLETVLATCGGGPIGVVGAHVALEHAAARRAIPTVRLPADAASVSASSQPACRTVVAHVDDVAGPAAVAWLRALAGRGPRYLCLGLPTAGRGEARLQWLQAAVRAGWRLHPLDQDVTPYASLDAPGPAALLLLERIPAPAAEAYPIDALRAKRDLHMDMLREAGRRADAHVARYMLARQFVRAGDRVLDAACGLGYGSAVLHDGTLCDSVEGLDLDPCAVSYATANYGADRPRVHFSCVDLGSLHERRDGSVDTVVSFETLEHLPRPDLFVREVARLLTPGGRFICSVPCLWVDADGRDPNPHHHHVFDRARLEALLQPHFVVEHVYSQRAGGGMKLPEATRSLRLADDSVTDDETEWWVVVAMVPVGARRDVPYRDGFMAEGVSRSSPLLDFASAYRNPWLVRSLVSIGIRSRSAQVLEEIARHVLATSPQHSADAGAALCAQTYQLLSLQPAAGEVQATLRAIDTYTTQASDNPHVLRWQVSLAYAGGLLALAGGRPEDARCRLRGCAAMDASSFSVLLDTKVVGAAFLAGWLALQAGDTAEARALWRAGVERAERDVRAPWDPLLLDRDQPPLFPLRELALVVEAASQCAAGLRLLPDADSRPGAVAAEIWNTNATRLAAAERHGRGLASHLDHWRAQHDRYVEFATHVPALAIVRGLPLPSTHAVAIFGTGAGGRLARDHVTSQGHRVVAYLDNAPALWDTVLDGIPVRAAQHACTCGADVVIIASQPGERAITTQLQAMALRHAVHFASIFDRV